VSKAFSPGQLRRINEHIAVRATEAVDNLLEQGPGDFITGFSDYLPSQIIADMVGIDDQTTRAGLVSAVTRFFSFADAAQFGGANVMETFAGTLLEIHMAGYAHLQERRSNPADDLMTALIEAEVDGERLTDQEIVSFFSALVVAGTDTTRNTTSFALLALTRFPEQRRLLLEDLPGRIDNAVMEMVRYSSPVLSFVRTATCDTELGGAHIAEGDRLSLQFHSANHDEAVFEHPHNFDILRDNAANVAWGGGGPHYCLGANLAKVELRTLWTELLTRIPTIRAAGEPKYNSSAMVNTIEHVDCEWD
jgi:cytochrome P450